MATDIFAKIGDIKGESLDAKHKDEIEVLSFSWCVTNAGGVASGSGGGAGKATFQDLSIVHPLDKASPKLLEACATGTHLKEATITHRKAGKGQQEFLIGSLWRLPRSISNTSRKSPMGRSMQGFTSSTTSRPTK